MPPKYIFGPVPSRRLGISLGIDIVSLKTCTFDCVYCECGPTTKLTTNREDFIDMNAVLAEIQETLKISKHLDYLTFSGSGEPTLNKNIGKIITALKTMSPVPVAVLTNGSLLSREDVIEDLMLADVVLPSLDAVSPNIFNGINRPHQKLHISEIINGLIAFRKAYPGEIWLEVFFVKGLNDEKAELDGLYQTIKKIRPDKVQLNSLDRPPAESFVQPVDWKTLEDIQEMWSDLPVEIIKRVRTREEMTAFSKNLEDNILNTISRRPLTADDLIQLTGKNLRDVIQYLDVLEREKKIYSQIVGEKIFYVLEK